MTNKKIQPFGTSLFAASLVLSALAACGGPPPEEDEPESLQAVRQEATTTYEVLCWKASVYDQDGDGYADRYAHKDARVSFWQPESLRMTCPAGYVMARGDCDDSNAAIHPRQPEVYGNGLDDNCDGRVDEPTFYYSFNGYDNTTSGFTMKVRIHDAQVVSAYTSPFTSLHYEVEYQKLSNTGTTYNTGKQKVSSMSVYSSYSNLDIPLGGLSATTVYRARVQFYKGVTTAPGSTTYTPIGAKSGWYYTTTDGTSAISLARTAILLRGLYEYYINIQYGFTGYMGSTYEDGTRYLADQDELWCSEFYSWVADTGLTIGSRASVSAITSYFASHGAWANVSDFNAVKSELRRGEYLALDTNGDGSSNHSAMVLDYDANLNVVFTVEGNTHGFTDWGDGYDSRRAGNETMVTTRRPEEVKGWGWFVSSML